MTSPVHNTSHVLLTLGVLFTLGGATRFLPAGTAAAEEVVPVAHTDEDQPVYDIEEPANYSSSARMDEICFTGETASLISEDRWLFEMEEEELKEQKLALQAKEEQLKRQAEELQALHRILEERWATMKQTSDEDIKHLSQMYAAMKPDAAAQIFNQMDPGFAGGFLRLMQTDQAGLILANMDPSKAYSVSVELATMNDDIRTANAAP